MNISRSDHGREKRRDQNTDEDILFREVVLKDREHYEDA